MKNLQTKIMVSLLDLKYRMEKAWKDERGDTNIIAIILIILVVIALAVLFRDKIGEVVTNLFDQVDSQTSGFYTEYSS